MPAVADQERMSPSETMKKKGPQRSQSRSALPGSSRNGLGKTTSMRLLTTRWRSRLTVSQTGSVSVRLAGSGPPNPSEAMEPETTGAGTMEPGGAAAENGSLAAGGSAGSAEEETGMEARGGDAGRAAEAAGATAAWGGAARARVSISSMSDCADDGWSGIVSPWLCDMAAGVRRAPARARWI